MFSHHMDYFNHLLGVLLINTNIFDPKRTRALSVPGILKCFLEIARHSNGKKSTSIVQEMYAGWGRVVVVMSCPGALCTDFRAAVTSGWEEG